MDLNSIVFTGLFIVIGGIVLVLIVSFLAYKLRNKQAYKVPVQNFQPREFFQPKPVQVPIQYYQVPIQQSQHQRYNYNVKQQPVQNYRTKVSPYQVYTN